MRGPVMRRTFSLRAPLIIALLVTFSAWDIVGPAIGALLAGACLIVAIHRRDDVGLPVLAAAMVVLAVAAYLVVEPPPPGDSGSLGGIAGQP